MTDREAQMWGLYQYNGYRVRVIQKWQDPYGRPMLRIEAFDDPDMAEGLAEAAFLAEAVLVPDAALIAD